MTKVIQPGSKPAVDDPQQPSPPSQREREDASDPATPAPQVAGAATGASEDRGAGTAAASTRRHAGTGASTGMGGSTGMDTGQEQERNIAIIQYSGERKSLRDAVERLAMGCGSIDEIAGGAECSVADLAELLYPQQSCAPGDQHNAAHAEPAANNSAAPCDPERLSILSTLAALIRLLELHRRFVVERLGLEALLRLGELISTPLNGEPTMAQVRQIESVRRACTDLLIRADAAAETARADELLAPRDGSRRDRQPDRAPSAHEKQRSPLDAARQSLYESMRRASGALLDRLSPHPAGDMAAAIPGIGPSIGPGAPCPEQIEALGDLLGGTGEDARAP